MTDTLDDARCAVGMHEITRRPCCEGCARPHVIDGWLHQWRMGQPKQADGGEWQCEMRLPAAVDG